MWFYCNWCLFINVFTHILLFCSTGWFWKHPRTRRICALVPVHGHLASTFANGHGARNVVVAALSQAPAVLKCPMCKTQSQFFWMVIMTYEMCVLWQSMTCAGSISTLHCIGWTFTTRGYDESAWICKKTSPAHIVMIRFFVGFLSTWLLLAWQFRPAASYLLANIGWTRQCGDIICIWTTPSNAKTTMPTRTECWWPD